jgi:uncharacterized protein with GYD domain
MPILAVDVVPADGGEMDKGIRLSGVVFLPEMSDAGAEALKESQERGDDAATQAVMVYLAMSAIYELMMSRDANKTRH